MSDDLKFLIQNSKQAYLHSCPKLLTWEITTACNKRCSFCYHSDNYLDTCKHVSNDTIKDCLSFLDVSGIEGLALTGGEPILHPKFNQILEAACKHVPNVTVFSNGIAIDRTLCELFVSKGVMVNYSFDYHDSKNFSILQRLISLLPPSLLTVSLVYSGENVSDFIDCLQNIRIHFSGDVYVNYAQFKGHAKYSSEALYNMVSLSKQLILLNMKSGIRIKGQYISDPIVNYFRKSAYTTFNCSICNNLKLDINGNVFPCPFFTDSSFTLGSIMSDINSQSFSSVIQTRSKHLKSLLYDRIANSKCERCKWVSFCGGGCLLSIENDTHTAINPISCSINKSIYEYINSIWNLY